MASPLNIESCHPSVKKSASGCAHAGKGRSSRSMDLSIRTSDSHLRETYSLRPALANSSPPQSRLARTNRVQLLFKPRSDPRINDARYFASFVERSPASLSVSYRGHDYANGTLAWNIHDNPRLESGRISGQINPAEFAIIVHVWREGVGEGWGRQRDSLVQCWSYRF